MKTLIDNEHTDSAMRGCGYGVALGSSAVTASRRGRLRTEADRAELLDQIVQLWRQVLPMSAIARELGLWTKIRKLERRVESGDGSLFDLRRDSIETIVDVMAGTVPLGKFESLKNAMVKKPADLKAAGELKQAMAG